MTPPFYFVFFFNDTATTEIYTLSLHELFRSRWNAQRRVFDVTRFFSKNRAQQLLLGSELGLALRRHLAHQHVARLDLGADVHDARLVEARELRLREVGDVPRDLLGSELGVARHHRQLLAM